MITASHLAVIDDYLRDLQAAVAMVKADPTLADHGGGSPREDGAPGAPPLPLVERLARWYVRRRQR